MSFKSLVMADALTSNLALRLKGKASGGADVTVVRSNVTVGSGPGSVQPAILVGTQAAGSQSNSATIFILPEQFNSTTGVASNVQVNAIGLAQEVYSPHYVHLVIENIVQASAITVWTSMANLMAVIGECIGTGMRVSLNYTAAVTAPTPANSFTATNAGSFVIDQYNPLTNSI
jgi:hypothetical protein